MGPLTILGNYMVAKHAEHLSSLEVPTPYDSIAWVRTGHLAAAIATLATIEASETIDQCIDRIAFQRRELIRENDETPLGTEASWRQQGQIQTYSDALGEIEVILDRDLDALMEGQ
jgi:DNA/RNA-binding domain of Phe-tRNA-synthetase-like protein